MEEKKSSGDSFEEQFKHKVTYEFSEGSIKVVDVLPRELVDNVPIILLPGWTENYETYEESLKILYKSGRRGISFEFSQAGGEKINDSDVFEEEYRKAIQINEVLDLKGITEVDEILHSYAALYGSIQILQNPKRVRNVVYDRPMGMAGSENKLLLFARWIRNRWKEGKLRPRDPKMPTSTRQVSARAMKYISENIGRAFTEGFDMARFDTNSFINRIADNGVMISLISGTEDLMAPLGRQIKHMEESGKDLPIEGFYAVKGVHNAISIDPEKYTALALDALNGLQARRIAIESR